LPQATGELILFPTTTFQTTASTGTEKPKMIRINSQTLLRVVKQLSQMLTLTRYSHLPVSISSSGSKTTIACQRAQCSIACELDIPNLPHQVNIPLSSLAKLKSTAKHTIAMQQDGQDLKIRYRDGTETRREVWQAASPLPPPPSANCWLENKVQLGQTLLELARLADAQAGRYSLNCLRLRGRDGQVAVTDGRLACAHDGFSLPFEEALVRAESLKPIKLLAKCAEIDVGSSTGWLHLKLVVGVARWWIDIGLESSARFPSIDQCFPTSSHARTTLVISEPDAQFLIGNLPEAMGTDQQQPIMLDAGQAGHDKQVSIRFRSPNINWLRELTGQEAQQTPGQVVELQLTGSSYERLPRQATLNHRHLVAALKLGYRQLHIPSYPAPAFCQQPGRKLVFTIYPVDYRLNTAPQGLVLHSSSVLTRAS
jgi:hypothetical protein